MNLVILEGNVGMDAEMLQNGICKWVVMTSDKFQNRYTGAVEIVTTFHNCYATGRTAEIASNIVRKGLAIFLEGSMEIEKAPNGDGVLASVRVRHVKCTRRLSDGSGGNR